VTVRGEEEVRVLSQEASEAPEERRRPKEKGVRVHQLPVPAEQQATGGVGRGISGRQVQYQGCHCLQGL
jgi:hypothetical protein